MSFLRSIIRDARRPLPGAGSAWVQRSSDEAPAMPPAPPVEEQDDGAFTVYRFQKEGVSGAREVSGRDTARREQPGRRFTSPLQPGVDTTVSTTAKTQTSEFSSEFSESSVNDVSQRSGLATGEAYAETRSTSVVPERSLSDENGSLSRLSDESTSAGPVPDRYDPADTRVSETVQHDNGKHELRRVPGTDAPSESYAPLTDAQTGARPTSVPAIALGDDGPAIADDGIRPPSANPSDEATVAAEPPRANEHRASMDATNAMDAPAVAAPVAEHDDGEPAVSTVDARPFAPEVDRRQRGAEDPGAESGQAGPRVQIGQIDVVVVSPPPATPAAPTSGRGFASRNYLRRL